MEPKECAEGNKKRETGGEVIRRGKYRGKNRKRKRIYIKKKEKEKPKAK